MVKNDDAEQIKLNKIFTKKQKIHSKCIKKNCGSIDKKIENISEDYSKNLDINCPTKNNSSDLKCYSEYYKKSEYGRLSNKRNKCYKICSKEEEEMNNAQNNSIAYYSKMHTKNTKKTKNNKKGGSKEIVCAQTILNIPRLECLKNCNTKSINDNIEYDKLNKEYDIMVEKECKPDDFNCIQKTKKSKLYKTLIDLESKISKDKDACISKNCSEDNAAYFDCINLGEAKCRSKYNPIIKKYNKHKLLSVECLHD